MRAPVHLLSAALALLAACGDAGPAETPAGAAAPVPVPVPVPEPEPVPASAPEPLLGEHTVSIPLGKTCEALLVLRAGQRALCDFEGSGAVLYDAHTHVGPETHIYDSGVADAGQVELTAPKDGLYGFLFGHGGTAEGPVRVRMAVRGEAVNTTFIDPEPDYPDYFR